MKEVKKDKKLARTLILGELSDLTLYRKLQKNMKSGEKRELIQELIDVEIQHVAFWKDFFQMPNLQLGWWQKKNTITFSIYQNYRRSGTISCT